MNAREMNERKANERRNIVCRQTLPAQTTKWGLSNDDSNAKDKSIKEWLRIQPLSNLWLCIQPLSLTQLSKLSQTEYVGQRQIRKRTVKSWPS